MRRTRLATILAAVMVLPACGEDPFSVEDALGTWDLQQLNEAAVSGTAPTGVWVRANGGSDSSLVVVRSIVLEFRAAAACVWTFDDGIQGAETEDDCQYGVAGNGDISVIVGGAALDGTGEATIMTLRDDATNSFIFVKRP